jgi:D-isomer specific 2-hydroxyacid dehydrogenase, NAD binding domain
MTSMPHLGEPDESLSSSGIVPELQTVDRLMEAALSAGLTISPEIKLIAVQHMVRTNLTLFRALFKLGLQPCNTFVIGKGYSTSASCLRALQGAGVQTFQDLQPPPPGRYEEAREAELRAFWRSVDGRKVVKRQEKVILVDVGGRLLSLAEEECVESDKIPRVIGVEQTTSGIRRLEARPRSFPIINVAQAAAKGLHESPLVAETILDRMDQRRPGRWPDMRVGVIGLGEIGRAMIAMLAARGLDVMGSDIGSRIRASNENPSVPLATLVERSEIIFGCTGCDIFKDGLPGGHQPNLILVSCSSEDVEFRGILREGSSVFQTEWPAQDVTIAGPSGPVTILVGGYPLNFDTSGISVAEQAIQATTALMLAGILTAAFMLSEEHQGNPGAFVQLPSLLQAAILQDWRQNWADEQLLQREIDGRATPEYLAAHSLGRSLDRQAVFAKAAAWMHI